MITLGGIYSKNKNLTLQTKNISFTILLTLSHVFPKKTWKDKGSVRLIHCHKVGVKLVTFLWWKSVLSENI